MENLGKLKKVRNGHRRNAQRLIDAIEGLFSQEILDKTGLELKCMGLRKQDEKIRKLDTDIENATDEENVEKEIDDATSFNDRMDEVLFLADKRLQDEDTERASVQEIHQLLPKAQVGRLPKLELPTFDGNMKKWHDFWDLFETAIHTRPDLAEIEKLQYLKGQLKGAALKLIDGFRLTAQPTTPPS